jgi:TolA-binding protein
MDTQEKFENYILGQMTAAEKAEFENEIENSPILKEQLELEQDIVGQIRNRAFVERQINTAKKEMQRGRIIRLMSYSISSIAALLLVFFVIQGVLQNRQCDQLYASNFTTPTNDYLMIDANSRGGQETTRGEAEVDSISAMKAYEKKDFETAKTQFNQIISEKDNPELRFYLAITQLETGKAKDALKTLQLLYTQPKEYRYYEQTRWYLALVHLKLHHKSEAKKYLDELVVLDGVYLDKAKDLIRNL